MSAIPTVNPIVPLPRDIDVNITISRPETEIATDMSLLVFVTPNVTTLPPNNGRVVLASTAQGLLDATGWTPNDTGYWAIQAWAQQTPRPQRMAIGRVFVGQVQGALMQVVQPDFTTTANITDGSFLVNVTNDAGVAAPIELTGINLTGVTTMAGLVTAIDTAITTAGAETSIDAALDYGGKLVLNAQGSNVSVSYAELASSGTDISTILNLTAETGAQTWDTYTPGTLVEEIQGIQTALAASNAPAFVITLDRQYRDTAAQKQVADYIETNLFRMAGSFATNLVTAYDSADTLNINKYIYNNAYRASSVIFSTYAQQYPDIAYPQAILATDYAAFESTKTAKFKTAAGITPENITETQLQVLTRYNTNVYTRTGNNLNYFREGTQGAVTWWTDSYYGWSNLREELQVAVLNGLYRRGKTPLSVSGQQKVVNDIGQIMQRYVFNGFLADRAEQSLELNVPYVMRKAYDIRPSPIFFSNRATRTLAPIQIDAYESGAIHKVNINIDANN